MEHYISDYDFNRYYANDSTDPDFKVTCLYVNKFKTVEELKKDFGIDFNLLMYLKRKDDVMNEYVEAYMEKYCTVLNDMITVYYETSRLTKDDVNELCENLFNNFNSLDPEIQENIYENFPSLYPLLELFKNLINSEVS